MVNASSFLLSWYRKYIIVIISFSLPLSSGIAFVSSTLLEELLNRDALIIKPSAILNIITTADIHFLLFIDVNIILQSIDNRCKTAIYYSIVITKYTLVKLWLSIKFDWLIFD